MSQSYKNSFFIVLGLLFLTPLFFIPGTAFPLDSAKSAIFSLGIIAAALVFIFEAWKHGSVSLPKHSLLYVVLLLPAVYLLSALLSTPSSLSLLGYNLEVGTFGFMLLGAVLLLLSTLTVSNSSRALQALTLLFAALALLALFTAFKVLTGGDLLVLGNFPGNMGNPLGSWTDLAIVFGLLSILTSLAIGMIPMKTSIKTLLYIVFAIGTALLVIINFSTAFVLTLGASVFLFLYFSRVENHYHAAGESERKKGFFAKATLLPIILALVSITFLVNPVVPGAAGRLSNLVANTFNVSNSDVRPTFGATLSISKAVLAQVALLGSGPNTFSHDWLIFKPLNVNTTPFWSIAFPYGIGFIPTQIATTGILGSALWAVFLALLVMVGFKALTHVPDSRAMRFTTIASLIITLFLWAAAFLYTPALSVLMLAFIFTGILLALMQEAGTISAKTFSLKDSPSTSLASLILILTLGAGALYLGWTGVGKTIASYHFQKAVNLSNTKDVSLAQIEEQLDKTVKYAPLDTYYVALARLNFSEAEAAANSESGTPEQNRAVFQEALAKSIASAKSAVSLNPAGYENWVMLGSLYSAIVPKPLSVEGAYENGRFAYNEALKRNPNNPELPLMLAQLEINNGNVEGARSYIRNSIALKEDYADAYLALAQLEIKENNIPAAISSTETLARLVPNNAGVHFELGVLKYSSADYQGAEASMSRALELVPDYANAKYYLALTYSKVGRTDEARAILEELITVNPDSAELKAALGELNKKK